MVAGSLLLVATLSIAACATSGSERPPSVGVAELVEGGRRQLARLKVESYYYEPDRLVVKVDVPVRLIIDSDTLLSAHGITIFAPEAGLQVSTVVPARQQITVDFLPTQSGEYPFHCNVEDHEGRGMVGVLQVVERLPGEQGRP